MLFNKLRAFVFLLAFVFVSAGTVNAQFVPFNLNAPGQPAQNAINMILELTPDGVVAAGSMLAPGLDCVGSQEVQLNTFLYNRAGFWSSVLDPGVTPPTVEMGKLRARDLVVPGQVSVSAQSYRSLPLFRHAGEPTIYRVSPSLVRSTGNASCVSGTIARSFTHIETAYLVMPGAVPTVEMARTLPVARPLDVGALNNGQIIFAASLPRKTKITVFQRRGSEQVESVAVEQGPQTIDKTVSLTLPSTFRKGSGIEVHMLDEETAVSIVYRLYTPPDQMTAVLAEIGDRW